MRGDPEQPRLSHVDPQRIDEIFAFEVRRSSRPGWGDGADGCDCPQNQGEDDEGSDRMRRKHVGLLGEERENADDRPHFWSFRIS